MGRKNRRKPFQCPVTGCNKRGLRADLLRHASVVHPYVTRDAYISALARGEMLPMRKPYTLIPLEPWSFPWWGRTSGALSIAVILLIVALAWVANGSVVN